MPATALHHALAEVAVLVAVAQLPGFVFAGAGAARHGGPADGTAGEFDVDFDGGVAAGVENLTAADGFDDGIKHVSNGQLVMSFCLRNLQ